MDLAQKVAANAKLALELFAESRDIRVEPVPHTREHVPEQPWRSMVTTTIARQTALTIRALALRSLATDSLAFFKENQFLTRQAQKVSEAAVVALEQFLRRNKRSFAAMGGRSARTLEGEIQQLDVEITSLSSAMRKARGPVCEVPVAGKINLLRLRRQRLQGLLIDCNRIVDFFEQFESKGRQRMRVRAKKRKLAE
jgi:hypothetical protein